MTFATSFTNWQDGDVPGSFPTCAPNMRQLVVRMQEKWHFLTNQGCYGRRAIRGGIAPSSHSFGAAIDIGFPARYYSDPVDTEIIPWLIGWSEELGVQAVHDYRRCRIWRAGRTPSTDDACGAWWKAQRASGVTGMGQVWANHLHVETSPGEWANNQPLAERGVD